MVALQSCRTSGFSGGKNTFATAYSPVGGSSIPKASLALDRMKASGIPNSIPFMDRKSAAA